MTTQEKKSFLESDFPAFLQTLDANAKGIWGVMNAQQMVEHMSYSIRIASGKDQRKILTPEEHLPKIRAFMLSDKPFRENTKNAELPEIPGPAKHPSMHASIEEMKEEWKEFIKAFENNPVKTFTNPFFGDLNFEEQVHLLHKHARHHARQFGME